MSMRDRQGRSKGHDYFFQDAFGHVRIPAPDLVWGDEIETVVLSLRVVCELQSRINYASVGLRPHFVFGQI
jgi:hypothetical protein